MLIQHGITGNKHVLGTEEECIEACNYIGKAVSSIRFVKKYDAYCIRVKSKKHKSKLKEFEKKVLTWGKVPRRIHNMN